MGEDWHSEGDMLTFDYDPHMDVLTVEGIKYSGAFFRSFARDIPLNTSLRIVSRDNGVVHIECVDESTGTPE